jgi:transcriptional regulator with XRE-family HTH domain
VVDGPVTGSPGLGFGGLLRRLRDDAGLTQDELAEAARVSQRAISDLERGINATARKDTAVLLAGALGLDGPARELFIAAARGRAPAGEALAAGRGGGAGAPAAAVTRTLPRDIASFTGRQAELGRLMVQLAGVAPSGVVGICAIGGMAGIGKTTLAVHAAHRLARHFPDGQLFLPLHAHTPGQRPVDPADALASLLLTAGIGARQIPAGVEARAGCWRDYLRLSPVPVPHRPQLPARPLPVVDPQGRSQDHHPHAQPRPARAVPSPVRQHQAPARADRRTPDTLSRSRRARRRMGSTLRQPRPPQQLQQRHPYR